KDWTKLLELERASADGFDSIKALKTIIENISAGARTKLMALPTEAADFTDLEEVFTHALPLLQVVCPSTVAVSKAELSKGWSVPVAVCKEWERKRMSEYLENYPEAGFRYPFLFHPGFVNVMNQYKLAVTQADPLGPYQLGFTIPPNYNGSVFTFR